MRRSIIAPILAIAFAFVVARPVAACQGPPLELATVARNVDVIALVEVLDRADHGGGYDYTLRVERVLKGAVGPTWTIGEVGTSDCGMPRLEVGDRVVLEYWAPGRMVDTPGPQAWFLAWSVAGDDRVTPSWPHEPAPETLDALMAAIGRVLPDTATEAPELEAAPEASEPPPSLLIVLVFAAGLLVASRLVRRRLASETERGVERAEV